MKEYLKNVIVKLLYNIKLNFIEQYVLYIYKNISL